MFTTAAQLLDLTDSMPSLTVSSHSGEPYSTFNVPTEKLLLVLRDGRKLIGVLRSWDQFANLVLTSTIERYFVTSPSSRLFADIPRGTYLVRGENVLMLGEVDLDRDEEVPEGFEEGAIEEVFALKKEEESLRKKSDKVREKRVGALWGGEMEGSGEILF